MMNKFLPDSIIIIIIIIEDTHTMITKLICQVTCIIVSSITSGFVKKNYIYNIRNHIFGLTPLKLFLWYKQKLVHIFIGPLSKSKGKCEFIILIK